RDGAVTLAQSEANPGFVPADAPAREDARDLLPNDRQPVAFDRQSVLLVYEARVVARGRDEALLRVGHVDDRAGDGRTVDVHVERREEDADDGRRIRAVA